MWFACKGQEEEEEKRIRLSKCVAEEEKEKGTKHNAASHLLPPILVFELLVVIGERLLVALHGLHHLHESFAPLRFFGGVVDLGRVLLRRIGRWLGSTLLRHLRALEFFA
jgi:hypothetical protein